MQDTEAGELEVRVSTNGQDLIVRVHAQDVTLRDRMLETLPELQQALAEEGLVEGRVDVGEQGLNGSGSEQGGPGEERQDAPTQTRGVSTTPSSTQNFDEPVPGLGNGRFHVVA